MKKLLVLLVMVTTVFMFIGCGSQNEAADNSYVETKAAVMSDITFDQNVEMGGANYSKSAMEAETEFDDEMMNERKIIKSASMDIQTLEYDVAVQKLKDKITGIGGYIESSNIHGRDIDDEYASRSAYFTIRVPVKHFENFMSDMMTVGTVIQSNTYGEDVTAQVFDHEAHKKTLEIQEERLLDILSRAEKVEDIIVLERELSEVRYEIENLTGTLKRLENLVSFSTLNISIFEVYKIEEPVTKPKTLGQKIAMKFNASLEDISHFFESLIVWALGSIPLLVIYIPLFIIIFLLGRRFLRVLKKKEVVYQTEEKKES